ncbi:MAG: restriction endonuclease [Rhodocyclaceae bacterium]|jgi:restriction system protein|nr:restriction endonuclease [Rhodocyclaceae bacterium]MCL4758909.1 restriction endonuclease [Rhodocyclaceae bacterium]
MAIPDFQSLMLPILRFVEDGETRSLSDARKHLAEVLSLTPSDLDEQLPSGRQRRFDNRVAWAKVYLEQAGLVNSPSRGMFIISPEGKKLLGENPENITISSLGRFERFRAFRATSKAAKGKLPTECNSTVSITPEERLDEVLDEMQESLEAEVLAQLRAIEPASFERFVVKLLAAMGYGVGEVTGRSGDGGIDGVIYEDRLKLDRIYLQAKRWTDSPVRAPDINGFMGALAKHGANRGVFVTTSRFTSDARQAVNLPHLRLVLIDGEELARLAVEHDVGVSTKRSIAVKRLDTDFFDDL